MKTFHLIVVANALEIITAGNPNQHNHDFIRNKSTYKPLHGRSNAVCAFASCPPPRFDNFLDSIIGSWTYAPEGCVPPITASVEEVMRSCGGAVQGVKEIKYQEAVFDQMYHNRADDGFVYFDCGSYISGPIDVQNNMDEVTFVSSFSLSTTKRMLISTSPIMSLSLVKGTSSSVISDEVDVSSNNKISNLPPDNVKFTQEILCRMSSPTQPWMLQRAKWEQFTISHDESYSIDNDNSGIDMDEGSCWITQSSLSQRDSTLWQSDELTTILKSSRISRVIQIGSILEDNVKAWLRCYDDDGKLRAVIFQHGHCNNKIKV